MMGLVCRAGGLQSSREPGKALGAWMHFCVAGVFR